MLSEFETPRLRLRAIEPGDVDRLLELDSDPEVMRYITGRASTREEVQEDVTRSMGNRWLAFARPSDEFIGWFGAIPSASGTEYEVGYRLRRPAWGRGYATEGTLALIDMLFAAGATRVFAQTMAVNARSRRVMDRAGLRHVRTFHLEFDDPLPGTELGEVEYELTRRGWEGRPQPPDRPA